MLVVLAACSTAPEGQTFCSAARPILLDRQDKLTKGTLQAIVALNETGVKLCGWQRP